MVNNHLQMVRSKILIQQSSQALFEPRIGAAKRDDNGNGRFERTLVTNFLGATDSMLARKPTQDHHNCDLGNPKQSQESRYDDGCNHLELPTSTSLAKPAVAYR